MRTLHMRQRSVQMRLEGLSSFACLLGIGDRGTQEQSLRGSTSPTHLSHFVHTHGVLGRWLVLGELLVLL